MAYVSLNQCHEMTVCKLAVFVVSFASTALSQSQYSTTITRTLLRLARTLTSLRPSSRDFCLAVPAQCHGLQATAAPRPQLRQRRVTKESVYLGFRERKGNLTRKGEFCIFSCQAEHIYDLVIHYTIHLLFIWLMSIIRRQRIGLLAEHRVTNTVVSDNSVCPRL